MGGKTKKYLVLTISSIEACDRVVRSAISARLRSQCVRSTHSDMRDRGCQPRHERNCHHISDKHITLLVFIYIIKNFLLILLSL